MIRAGSSHVASQRQTHWVVGVVAEDEVEHRALRVTNLVGVALSTFAVTQGGTLLPITTVSTSRRLAPGRPSRQPTDCRPTSC